MWEKTGGLCISTDACADRPESTKLPRFSPQVLLLCETWINSDPVEYNQTIMIIFDVSMYTEPLAANPVQFGPLVLPQFRSRKRKSLKFSSRPLSFISTGQSLLCHNN